MSLYLALDPGLTTGIAWYRTDSYEEFGSLEVHGRHELYDYLSSEWGLGECEYNDPLPDVVVIERWDVRKNTHQLSNQDDVRYIIGHVEGLCYSQMVTYIEQRPAEAKKFATDDKLRALTWYSGGEGHADDAARHLLVALAKAQVPEIIEAIV